MSVLKNQILHIASGLLILALLQSCAPSISPFSETAYQQAVELKVVSLNLVEKADQPYDEYRDDVEAVRLALQKALEFARGRPDNEISTQQWEILLDPDRNLLGGFLKRWEEDGTLSTIFVNEFRDVVSDAFDTIIGLESGKIKPDEL